MAPKKSFAALEAVFKEHSPAEEYLRTGTTLAILMLVIFHSTVFGREYPSQLQELYVHPWWRLLVVGLVGLGAWWCPRVGIALALLVFFYFNSMAALSNQ